VLILIFPARPQKTKVKIKVNGVHRLNVGRTLLSAAFDVGVDFVPPTSKNKIKNKGKTKIKVKGGASSDRWLRGVGF